MNTVSKLFDWIKTNSKPITTAVAIGSITIGFGGLVGWFAIPTGWLYGLILVNGICGLD